MRNLATLVGFLFYAQCFGQSLFIELDTNRTGVDDGLSIVLSNGTYDQYPNIQGYTDVFLGVGADTFFFQYSPQSLVPNASYQISTLDTQRVYTYTLRSTPLSRSTAIQPLLMSPNVWLSFNMLIENKYFPPTLGLNCEEEVLRGIQRKLMIWSSGRTVPVY